MNPTRRHLIGAAAASAAGAATLAAGRPSERPSERPSGRPSGRPGRREVTTFVFVAGASGTAGAPGELVARGHRALGVDLPGHGPSDAQFPVSYQAPQDLERLATEPSPLKGVGLDDFVKPVVDVVRRVARLGPVILVGGSMGGSTLSRVGNAIPHLIDRIVYDSAFLCVDLESPAKYLATPEGSTHLGWNLTPALIGDPEKLGAVRINYRLADPKFLAGAKAAFMEDATDAEFMNMLATLQPDESLTVPIEDARVEARTWGRIPRTFIRHTLDRTIPIALQDRMIAEADRLTPRNPTDVRTVRTSHAATPARYREIVDILDDLARHK